MSLVMQCAVAADCALAEALDLAVILASSMRAHQMQLATIFEFCCIDCYSLLYMRKCFHKQDGRLFCQFLQVPDVLMGVQSTSTAAPNDMQPNTSAQGNLEDPYWFIYPSAALVQPHMALIHRREVCLVLYSSCACDHDMSQHGCNNSDLNALFEYSPLAQTCLCARQSHI